MSCCSDVMKPVPAASCCTPRDTAADAARMMRDTGSGCAPVIESEKDLRLLGVVTERDVCCGVAADDRRASDVRVREIMRAPSACCGASDSLDVARKQLREQRATSLPVVDKAGGCCGIVSVHDVHGM